MLMVVMIHKKVKGSGETVQWVKRSPGKHEDLSWDLQHRCQKLAHVVMCAHDSSVWETKTEVRQ